MNNIKANCWRLISRAGGPGEKKVADWVGLDIPAIHACYVYMHVHMQCKRELLYDCILYISCISCIQLHGHKQFVSVCPAGPHVPLPLSADYGLLFVSQLVCCA